MNKKEEDRRGGRQTDSLGAVEEDDGQDGAVELGLYLLVVLELRLQQRVVARVEQQLRHWVQHREDVPRTGRVLAPYKHTIHTHCDHHVLTY